MRGKALEMKLERRGFLKLLAATPLVGLLKFLPGPQELDPHSVEMSLDTWREAAFHLSDKEVAGNYHYVTFPLKYDYDHESQFTIVHT